MIFQPCPSRPRCYRSYETGRVEHSGGESRPPKQPCLFRRGTSRPPALIPAPRGLQALLPTSSFVGATSPMCTSHAPAETRQSCGYRGSIHCCPADGYLVGIRGGLRCQTNTDDSPATSANLALHQQRNYFVLHGVDNRVNTDDLRCSCLASSTLRRPCLPVRRLWYLVIP